MVTMEKKKQRVFSIILLNMLDNEISKIIESELDEAFPDMENVHHLIELVDDIEVVTEILGKDMI